LRQAKLSVSYDHSAARGTNSITFVPAPFLAMSLSSLFDISQPTDCLRAALNMLTEYEQDKEENDRPKMVPPVFFSSPSDTSFNHRLCIVHRQCLVRTCPLIDRATTGMTESQNQLVALPARLYPDSALASGHPLRILRQAPRALALPNTCSADAPPPRHFLPLP
jgi:hypothetical protein